MKNIEMKKVKVGIIGCGNFALAQHLPNCMASDMIILRACCDLCESNLEKAKQFNPEYTTSDYQKMLDDKEIDIVIVSVPHKYHKVVVEQAISAGKNVLCEKPMVMTMEDSYDVMKMVRDKGVKLCIDYNRRFSPSMVDMKKAYHGHRNNTKRDKARIFTPKKLMKVRYFGTEHYFLHSTLPIAPMATYHPI